MTDALGWAVKIHSYLAAARVNAFVWWFLSDMLEHGNGTDNSALTDIKGNIPKRAYVTGNWSKFVRPGWQRVDVTNNGSLLVTAFQSADRSQSAVVVVNSGSTARNQVFEVSTQMGTSVTPWITSSKQSLARQTPLTVSGGSLTYTIPANSVVTLVGSTTDGDDSVHPER
jgi:glucuronoarabinoxylan endo-1,4-beta-xylanase